MIQAFHRIYPKGDDVTVRIQMQHIANWNLADSKAGRALRVKGRSRQLDA